MSIRDRIAAAREKEFITVEECALLVGTGDVRTDCHPDFVTCQFCHQHPHVVTMCDGWTAWYACAVCAAGLPHYWKPINVERDPDRPGWLREQRAN